MPLDDLHEPVRHRAVERRIGLADDDGREDRPGFENAHPGLDAEVARFARRGDDGRGVGGVGRDRDRPAAKRLVMLLLDRRKGAIEVDDHGRRVGGVQPELDGLRGRRVHNEQMFAPQVVAGKS